MKRWTLVALALGAYAIGLIATAPAALVDAGLQHASGGSVRLTGAQGTLWSGAGVIELRDRGGQTGYSQQVAWRFLPGELLRARLAGEVKLGAAARPFTVAANASQVELFEADISLPAAALGLAIPKLAPLRLTGELAFHVATLRISKQTVRGTALLRWHGAGSAATSLSPLGDYEARCEGDGSIVRAVVRTLKGPVQLDGQMTWTIGESPVLAGTARIPAALRDQLAPLLRLNAIERGDGVFEFRLR